MVVALPSHGLYAPPQRRFIRRDLPEIAIPIDAEVAASNPGTAAWAQSAAFAQLVASSAAEYVTCSLGVSLRQGRTLTANGVDAEAGLWTAHLYTGAAASEVERAARALGLAHRISITGIVDDAVTSQALAQLATQLPMYGMRIPAATRITAKTACSLDGATHLKVAFTWLLVYDATLIAPARLWAWDEDEFAAGGDSYQNASKIWPATPAALNVTSSGTNWVYGSWLQVDAALDADYLIEGISMGNELSGTNASVQAQLGLGAGGSEVAQSTTYQRRLGTDRTGGFYPFTHPFIAFKGERLAVRLKASSASVDADVNVYGIKVHGAF